MKYQAYEEYKGSGVEWLGSIPVSWHALSIKRISEIFNGATPKSGEKAYWDGDVSWVTPADLGKTTSPFISSGARSITIEGFDSCGTSLVPVGTILLSSRAPIGTLGIAANDLCTNQGCKSLVVDKMFYSKYLYYVLLSSTKQLNLLGRGTTFLELSSDELGGYKIGFPPKGEQQKITNFLDHETAKIDTLIEKQQQLIKLLKEKRQAVISHAVTKGLNPNAPMRDSGVEWLGEVPEHWKASVLKYFSRIIDCKHITAEFFDEGIPLASIGEVKEWFVNLSSAKLTSEKFYLDLIGGDRKPRAGDIIYSRNATVGEAAVVPENMPDFAMGQDVCLMRIDEMVLPEYILYVMKSGIVSQQLDLAMVGSTFKRINVDDIRNFLIAIPSYDEQVDIAKELNRIAGKYDDLISKAEVTIELMQERRTGLISSAVTGKIDVRNWQPSHD